MRSKVDSRWIPDASVFKISFTAVRFFRVFAWRSAVKRPRSQSCQTDVLIPAGVWRQRPKPVQTGRWVLDWSYRYIFVTWWGIDHRQVLISNLLTFVCHAAHFSHGRRCLLFVFSFWSVVWNVDLIDYRCWSRWTVSFKCSILNPRMNHRKSAVDRWQRRVRVRVTEGRGVRKSHHRHHHHRHGNTADLSKTRKWSPLFIFFHFPAVTFSDVF